VNRPHPAVVLAATLLVGCASQRSAPPPPESDGAIQFRCRGLPVAARFDDPADPTRVLLRYMGQAVTASRVPDTTGQRFVGPGNVMFWIRGDRAMLAWLDEPPLDCLRQPAAPAR
jgi:membrane-bound inhibitor of C-type lysozyme